MRSGLSRQTYVAAETSNIMRLCVRFDGLPSRVRPGVPRDGALLHPAIHTHTHTHTHTHKHTNNHSPTHTLSLARARCRSAARPHTAPRPLRARTPLAGTLPLPRGLSAPAQMPANTVQYLALSITSTVSRHCAIIPRHCATPFISTPQTRWLASPAPNANSADPNASGKNLSSLGERTLANVS